MRYTRCRVCEVEGADVYVRFCTGPRRQPLESRGPACCQLDLRGAQDTDNRGNGRRKLCGISDGRPRRPLDQNCGRVALLDQLDDKAVGSGYRTDCQ